MRLLQDYLFCEVQSHFVNLASTVRLLYLLSTCTAAIVHLFIHLYIDSTLPSNQSGISVVCNKRNVSSHCGVILHLKLNIYIQKKKKKLQGVHHAIKSNVEGFVHEFFLGHRQEVFWLQGPMDYPWTQCSRISIHPLLYLP